MPETQPRPEHPRPQFQRNTWSNLNGTWNFAIDTGKSGEAKGWPQNPAELNRDITVPFCPESSLSGIQHTDFMPSVWYHRTLDIPDEWADKRVFLHFGAVDYHCKAWVNSRLIGQHYGGSSSFTYDITDALTSGANHLVVCANDDTRSSDQPSGKQCPDLYSRGCHYTRVTGIWQTVWLEAVPESRIETVRIVPDLDSSRFVLTPTFKNAHRGHTFRAVLLNGKEEVAVSTMPATSGAAMSLRIKNPQPWSPANPHLYDLRFELCDSDTTIDTVNSYAGLRKFHIEGHKFYLNNTPIFLRLVLDQGFYPDGIWTAPSDDMLKNDIEKSLAVGFNGARLHQKVFEERFHYWADKLGYLTWGEYCDWGMNFGSPQSIHNQQREWREIVQRDLNHPSILAWTPYNETRGGATNHFEAHRQRRTGNLRPHQSTRPFSTLPRHQRLRTRLHGHLHRTRLRTGPRQIQSNLCTRIPRRLEKHPHPLPRIECAPYQGQPYVVDEYGGTWWDPNAVETEQAADRKSSWGYGKRPTDIEEVYHRIEKLTAILLNHPNIAGYCYTQLTDIEQEQNGIYTYDRREKFDAKRLKKYFGAPAAIERIDE